MSCTYLYNHIIMDPKIRVNYNEIQLLSTKIFFLLLLERIHHKEKGIVLHNSFSYIAAFSCSFASSRTLTNWPSLYGYPAFVIFTFTIFPIISSVAGKTTFR